MNKRNIFSFNIEIAHRMEIRVIFIFYSAVLGSLQNLIELLDCRALGPYRPRKLKLCNFSKSIRLIRTTVAQLNEISTKKRAHITCETRISLH